MSCFLFIRNISCHKVLIPPVHFHFASHSMWKRGGNDKKENVKIIKLAKYGLEQTKGAWYR